MKVSFLLPGTTPAYHCGGLFYALNIARLMGDKTIMVMRGHGVTVVGPTVHDAFDETYMAERTTMYQMTAMQTGMPLHKLPDGLRGHEGTFSLCTFWYVDALARTGELEEARLTFEKMLTYANHLGLFSEEIGPRGEQLGNFPQAFTHLALITAAVHLDAALNEAERHRR